jgi:hypothetical protein
MDLHRANFDFEIESTLKIVVTTDFRGIFSVRTNFHIFKMELSNETKYFAST